MSNPCSENWARAPGPRRWQRPPNADATRRSHCDKTGFELALPIGTAGNCPVDSKLERSVIDDFLHDEERSRLPHAGQRDQLFAGNSVETRHVFVPDFQEIIEVAVDQVAIEYDLQFRHGYFERRETLPR